LGILLLTWYSKCGKDGKEESNSTTPPAPVTAKMVRVAGNPAGSSLDDGGGDAARCGFAYTVDCLEAGGEDTAQVCRVNVLGKLPAIEKLTRPDSSATVAPKIIYPFADSIKAVLLMFGEATALLCDSSVFAPRSEGERSPFWERLDLVVIPPASEEMVLLVREQFRPRFLAVIPPCTAPPAQNIICGDDSSDGFRYDFEIKNGKLETAGEQ
jgi:hypothetical protein